MAFRIYADLPITADAQAVAGLLREAATKAGCAMPKTEMYWRGEGHELEIFVWCAEALITPKRLEPASLEAGDDKQATP